MRFLDFVDSVYSVVYPIHPILKPLPSGKDETPSTGGQRDRGTEQQQQ
jgi:hypothetical protein